MSAVEHELLPLNQFKTVKISSCIEFYDTYTKYISQYKLVHFAFCQNCFSMQWDIALELLKNHKMNQN